VTTTERIEEATATEAPARSLVDKVEQTRRSQGLPARVVDPTTLAKVAQLLDVPRLR
jgi:hypothetical protein